ncbi:MAG: hypothetical protein WBD41_14310 [Rhodococcus sp. (in: high G+C Gram-positive bacteria)]
MRKVLPYPPAAVRDFFRTVPELTDIVPIELIRTGKPPREITRPYILVRPLVTTGKDPLLKSPIVQLEACAPPLETYLALPADDPIRIMFGSTDPEELVWDIAALAGELITRAKNSFQFRNSNWKGAWIEGPLIIEDTSRGEGQLIYRAPIRIQLRMLTRSS